jgi:hypothetical protein
MKKLLKIGVASVFIVALASFSTTPAEDFVYICKGPSATKYHYTPKCRGLKNCSTDIYKITKAEAVKEGRGLCGYED